MAVGYYSELKVWHKSMDLAVEIYQLVKFLPKEELYGLSDQMRRAVVSIPSNIAEGHQRSATKDYIRFLFIAKGSLGELETQLLLCERLGYVNNEISRPIYSRCEEIGRMLSGLINSLQEKLKAGKQGVEISSRRD